MTQNINLTDFIDNKEFKSDNILPFSKKVIKSEIISCSRRTDIPAFNLDWLIDNLNKGYVEVSNPFNKNQVSIISLKPYDVKCWVWWSKDFGEWINRYSIRDNNKNNNSKNNTNNNTNNNNQLNKSFKKIIDSYPLHIFNFTINSPSELEPGMRTSLNERLKQLKFLVENFGVECVQPRFDPIVFYKKKNDSTGKIYNNLDQFEHIVSKISEFGIKDLIFSFATVYSKVKKRMKKRGKIIIDPPLSEKKEILDKLIEICNSNGINLNACCQPELVGYKGIKQSHCIDGEKISRLLKQKEITIKIKPDKGQRESCGCSKSRDIGGYSGIFLCKHGCDYCYARPV